MRRLVVPESLLLLLLLMATPLLPIRTTPSDGAKRHKQKSRGIWIVSPRRKNNRGSSTILISLQCYTSSKVQ
uniref:Putative secreted protein n=1 Tax=Anopheles triannulatus TaxID=58253 RepID=A0A2M4B1V8_9DIPT